MDAVAIWQERIRVAVANGGALAIRGSGSKDFYGETIRGDLLDTSNYAGIVDYEPNELVVTARAGTTLEDMERTLAASGQMLAFEPPQFGPGATLGGAIATGLSGPRRPYAGAARDLVLGMRIIDGRGDDLTFGGRVMKNVAGFDVTRLLTGALGTLGVIAEVSLKCLPLPRQEATRTFALSTDEAIRRVNEWGGQPLPLSATAFVQGRLFVRWSGAAPAVESAIARMGGDALADGGAFWRSIRDHAHPFFDEARKPEHVLWRLSVKSTAPYADLGGHQLIEWGGALRWLVTTPSNAPERLRAWAQSHGGHATLFYATNKSQGVFHPLPPAMEAIQRRLKAEFDPHRVLNPGRMYAMF
ncbi:MAG TPA: glycolate oxidase subunit GlcE [Casimicrobiaceae bacterium]|nr:glycolate oxidase subunit GlcE [Casimicrobiaceae bacterium]